MDGAGGGGLTKRIIKVRQGAWELDLFHKDDDEVMSKLVYILSGCLQETQRLLQEPVAGIDAIPDENNARYFHVAVAGPEGVRNQLSVQK